MIVCFVNNKAVRGSQGPALHDLGYMRIRETTLRIDYSNLMEAKRGLVERTRGLLDQILPEGMYAGGL